MVENVPGHLRQVIEAALLAIGAHLCWIEIGDAIFVTLVLLSGLKFGIESLRGVGQELLQHCKSFARNIFRTQLVQLVVELLQGATLDCNGLQTEVRRLLRRVFACLVRNFERTAGSQEKGMTSGLKLNKLGEKGA